MPSVDHSIVELDDGPPGDEGDVEVLWHRASGRASTPPPGPPGDAYDPFQPSEDDIPAPRGPPPPSFGPRGGIPPLPGRSVAPPPGRGGPPLPGDGVVTLDSWRKSQEQKLNKSGLGLPPPLPPPPMAPPSQGSNKPPPPNVMDVFPKKLSMKVPVPEAPVPVPVSFIKDADNEADSQRERERKRFLTNSAMGVDEAKMRLKAYAATVADKEGNFGMMYPSEKKKNKELKKFFDDHQSADEPSSKYKTVGRNVSDTLVDKMAQITKETDQEKAEYEKKVEKHIKELKREKRRKRSRSGSREKRESRDRDSRSHDRDSRSRDRDSRASRSRDSKSKRKTRDRSDSSNEGRREDGDGKEDFTLSKQFSPAPDPSTKEGRAKLYRIELEEKSKQYMEWQKHVAGKEEWEMELEGTAAFKYMEDTPSPDRQPEYLDPEFRPGGPGMGVPPPPRPPGASGWDNEGPPQPPKPTPNPSQQNPETATGFLQYPPPPRPPGSESSMPPKPPAPCPPPPGIEEAEQEVDLNDLNKLYNDPKLYEQATSLPGATAIQDPSPPDSPEPDDGMDPVTRSKMKAAAVMNKLAEVKPPVDYKMEEDQPIMEEPKPLPRLVETVQA